MVKYETLSTIPVNEESIVLRSHSLPELVHMEDSAFSVLCDFSHTKPFTIHDSENMEEAIHEMKATGAHILMVIDDENHITGLLSSEDLLGEKPIKIIQEGRINRSQVLVKALMSPLKEIAAFDYESVEHARVGNIVVSMQELKAHYALVIKTDANNVQSIEGLFNTSQISKQLHQRITPAATQAQSISELHKRHKD